MTMLAWVGFGLLLGANFAAWWGWGQALKIADDALEELNRTLDGWEETIELLKEYEEGEGK